MDFPQQGFVSLDIKVVQEIRDEHEVVAGSELYLERAARDSGMPLRYAGLLCVFLPRLRT